MLAGCATTARPQPYRTFFLPPKAADAPAGAVETAPPEPPPALDLYANEVPSLPVALPALVRPPESEFLLRQAENYFGNGKRAFQEGRAMDARRDFDRALRVLLAAPDNLPDRGRIESRLEEWIDAIYKYDLDQAQSQNGEDPDAEKDYAKRPLDEILEMTFPVDPSLRGKVRKMIGDTGSELPLEETDAVLSYIQYFTASRGLRTLEGGLKRQGRYKAMIERVFTEEQVPKELIFLAQAESGFQPRALSPARLCGPTRCAGMWQFAGFRGKEYGLMQTVSTDDRLDPELSTRAAARHLRDLYMHFGDWYLAMAAYNCGPGCVDSAIARTGYADFWELRRLRALPRETANYVPAILAMTIVTKNASEYGVMAGYDPALEYDTVTLVSPTHVALAAAAVDLPVSELRELNPALTRTLAPTGYALHVPKGTVEQVEAAFAVIPEARRNAWRLHRVEYGDTTASLGKRYGTTAAALASANGGELPEAGLFAAIPVGYPGDPVTKVTAKVVRKAPAKVTPAKAGSKTAPVKAQAKASTKAPRKAASKPAPPVARVTKPPRRRSGV